jgi:hypothetical protein
MAAMTVGVSPIWLIKNRIKRAFNSALWVLSKPWCAEIKASYTPSAFMILGFVMSAMVNAILSHGQGLLPHRLATD